MNNIQTWYDWKVYYHDKIQHEHGFEERFVDEVLTRLQTITPHHVIPQYHFKDDVGGNRYIDFMIKDPNGSFEVAIELDGYSKMLGDGQGNLGTGKDYHRFNDFLLRQNAITKQFRLLLRYSNKHWLNNTQRVIYEINQVISQQIQEYQDGINFKESLQQDLKSKVNLLTLDYEDLERKYHKSVDEIERLQAVLEGDLDYVDYFDKTLKVGELEQQIKDLEKELKDTKKDHSDDIALKVNRKIIKMEKEYQQLSDKHKMLEFKYKQATSQGIEELKEQLEYLKKYSLLDFKHGSTDEWDYDLLRTQAYKLEISKKPSNTMGTLGLFTILSIAVGVIYLIVGFLS